MNKYRILCIDDDRDFLSCLQVQLHACFMVVGVSSINHALTLLLRDEFDLVLLDVELGGDDGIEGIGRLRAIRPEIDIAMLSGQRDPKTVVSAIRAGAIDYLVKPLSVDDLKAIVKKQAPVRQVRERYKALIAEQNDEESHIVHKSEAIKSVLKQAEQLKGYQANVLIVGETGTGKEVLARYIHRLENNPSRPFIAVNCAAIPDNLIEAELFGCEAGAYTGAIKRRIGKFELADGGDIFLDEVGALKNGLQAKILRVLQEREFTRVGGNEVIRADFRVISATNEPLEIKIASGELRADLYHRLRVIEIFIPPLHDRIEDIPPLVDHFLLKFAKNGVPKQISMGAMGRLLAYHWPGNIRELANVIQGLTILTPTSCIDETIFPPWALNGVAGKYAMPDPPVIDSKLGALKDYVAFAQRRYIEFALRSCKGDKSKTARVLKVGRTTLYEKMRELGIIN